MNSTNHNTQSNKENENFDIKSFLSGYFKYWYYFLLSLIITLAISYYYIWYTTPLYLVQSTILVSEENKGNSGAKMFKELDLFANQKVIENEIEILKSKRLIEDVINELEFDVAYYLLGNVKISEVYKYSPFIVRYESIDDKAYYYDFDITILSDSTYKLVYQKNKKINGIEDYSQVHKFGEDFLTPFGEIKIENRPGNDLSKFNDPILKVIDNSFRFKFINKKSLQNRYEYAVNIEIAGKKSTVLKLSTIDAVPEKGVDFLNKLMEVYINNSINEKNKLAFNTNKFILERLSLIAGNLNEIEHEVEDYKTNKGIVDIGSEAQMFLQNVKQLDAELSQINSQLNVLDYLKTSISKKEHLTQLAPSTLGIEDPLLLKLTNQLMDLEMELDRLKQTSKPESPIIFNKNIIGQIAKTKEALFENIKSIQFGLNIRKDDLVETINKYESLIRALPRTSRELIGIQRQQSIKENLYLFLLQKQEETAINLASTVADSKVIDYASSSGFPVKPIKNSVYLIAVLLAFVIPTGVITAVNVLNNNVLDKSDIERITNAPVLGVISQSDKSGALVVSEAAKSAISEQFRSIRTNLQYIAAGAEQKVILVTSSMGGEGKTFISLNIGATLALSGKKTVVLEFDLRKPKLSKGLNLPNDIGLSNYLIGAVTLNQIIKSSKVNENLDIISSGPIPPNPSELLLTETMKNLIVNLKEIYDYVIIDSPPVGLVTDGLLLDNFANTSIYVIRQNHTKIDHLEFINELYVNKKLNNLSIVFNGVKSGVGKYGYGYGYGYGYYEEKTPKTFFEKLKQKIGRN